ncbi:MAG: LysM peptidoglycan-binding domain-containing protein [Trueperaceae bacterium]|nr:LysM peptidoglycan-binding domain-containing protein [Trueperaceae bacterium]
MKRLYLFICLSLSLFVSGAFAQDAASRLAEEQAALSQLRVDFVQKVAELDSRIQTLEANKMATEQAYNDLKIRFVQEIASREERIAGLEAQLAEQTSNSAGANNQALETRLAEEQTALANLRVKLVQEVANREDRIAELENQLAATEEQPSASDNSAADTSAMTNLQSRLAEEQEALAQLRVRFVQEIASREAQIEELSSSPSSDKSSEVSALQSRLAEEQEALAQLRVKFVQEVASRENQIEELTANLAQEQDAMVKLQNQMDQNLAQANTTSEGKIADLEAQVASLTSQLEDAQAEISSLTSQLSSAQTSPPANSESTPAGTTDSATGPAEGSSYIVVSGDTLSSIALSFYGDSSFWTRIATANNITFENANVLEPGTLLVIPAE